MAKCKGCGEDKRTHRMDYEGEKGAQVCMDCRVKWYLKAVVIRNLEPGEFGDWRAAHPEPEWW